MSASRATSESSALMLWFKLEGRLRLGSCMGDVETRVASNEPVRVKSLRVLGARLLDTGYTRHLAYTTLIAALAETQPLTKKKQDCRSESPVSTQAVSVACRRAVA